MSDFILSIDQGTTGTTAILIDTKDFSITGKVNQEYPQIYPEPGMVEHNLNDIWESTKSTVISVLKKTGISPGDIKSIGITNQRETTCAFDNSGSPIENAIVWQDRRTTDFCNSHKEEFDGKYKKVTGLPLDPYFSGTKIKWLLENSLKVQKAQKDNNLKFGTIDTFLLYKLTNGNSYLTETTNASRTLLMNIKECQWDNDLLRYFNIDKTYLPEIKDSIDDFGVTNGLDFLPDGIKINCILGDQQAALFGQAGYKQGSFKCTYGTGSFALLNTGETVEYSDKGLLTTVAFSHKGKKYYALEGSCYIAGAAVQWLRDNLNFFSSSPEIESLANEVKDLSEMKNLIFMPFFTGLGSPYWIAEAKGAILGLTRDTNKKHISRACLDGIAMSINDLFQAFSSTLKIDKMNVDGGACANNLLMQIQANFIKAKVVRPKVIETTAYGAGIGAAIGSGIIEIKDVDKLWQFDQEFNPEGELSYYVQKKSQWNDYIKRLFY
jgi:glycerol kinase